MNKLVKLGFIVFMFLALEAIPLGFVDLHLNYILVAVCLPYLIFKNKTIDFWLVIILSLITVSGLINVLLGNNDFPSLLKNTIGVFIGYWFYFLIIKYFNFDLNKLFKLYYKFAGILAYIGLLQFVSFLLGLKYGYNFTWLGFRQMGVSELGGLSIYPIHSLTGEPSSYALILSPAIYYSICKLTDEKYTYGTKFQAIIIITTIILSQSSTGYFALLVSLCIKNLDKISLKRIVFFAVAVPAMFLLLYTTSYKFKDRLDSSIGLLTGQVIVEATGSSRTNGSSLILFNHFMIAKENAKDHPFGTGLGSHHVAFYNYNTMHTWFTGYGKNSILLNLHDASSLFNRLLSETGFVGIFIVFWFILKNFLRKKGNGDDLVVLNHASIVFIFTALLRSGHYFVYGLPFFVLTFYYSSSFYKNNLKSTVPENESTLHP